MTGSQDAAAAVGAPPEPTGGRPRRFGLVLGLVAGLAAVAIGVLVWVLLNLNLGVGFAWVALFVGVGIAAAVVVANGARTWPATIVVVLLTVLAAGLSQNFLQREQLQDGIDELQKIWSDLQVDVVDPAATTPDGRDAYDRPAGCTVAPDVVPPPEIVKVLPLAAYECFTPEVLAIVYDDVPAELRPQINPDLRAATEAIIAADQAKAAQTKQKSDLESAREKFDRADYDIPAAVLACAPPPDFTQPNAAAGLGFPDGVPLFLPISDIVNGPRERGDGLEYDNPTPFCFAWEDTKDKPFEAASWIAAVIVAFVASRLIRRPRTQKTSTSPAPPG